VEGKHIRFCSTSEFEQRLLFTVVVVVVIVVVAAAAAFHIVTHQ